MTVKSFEEQIAAIKYNLDKAKEYRLSAASVVNNHDYAGEVYAIQKEEAISYDEEAKRLLEKLIAHTRYGAMIDNFHGDIAIFDNRGELYAYKHKVNGQYSCIILNHRNHHGNFIPTEMDNYFLNLLCRHSNLHYDKVILNA